MLISSCDRVLFRNSSRFCNYGYRTRKQIHVRKNILSRLIALSHDKKNNKKMVHLSVWPVFSIEQRAFVSHWWKEREEMKEMVENEMK